MRRDQAERSLGTVIVDVEQLRKQHHYAICFANSTNKHIESPRATTWDEVRQLILEWRKGAPTA